MPEAFRSYCPGFCFSNGEYLQSVSTHRDSSGRTPAQLWWRLLTAHSVRLSLSFPLQQHLVRSVRYSEAQLHRVTNNRGATERTNKDTVLIIYICLQCVQYNHLKWHFFTYICPLYKWFNMPFLQDHLDDWAPSQTCHFNVVASRSLTSTNADSEH